MSRLLAADQVTVLAHVLIYVLIADGGLFIFDLNTVYKHREILGDNTFVMDEEGIYCVWQNFFNPEKNTVDICLDFFEENEEHYIRSSEDITEKAYTEDEISAALQKAGLEILAVYDDNTYENPSETCERAVYVTRKRR